MIILHLSSLYSLYCSVKWGSVVLDSSSLNCIKAKLKFEPRVMKLGNSLLEFKLGAIDLNLIQIIIFNPIIFKNYIKFYILHIFIKYFLIFKIKE